MMDPHVLFHPKAAVNERFFFFAGEMLPPRIAFPIEFCHGMVTSGVQGGSINVHLELTCLKSGECAWREQEDELIFGSTNIWQFERASFSHGKNVWLVGGSQSELIAHFIFICLGGKQ